MRLNDGRVLPAFIGQALRGENITVFGDGKQTRTFLYIDDCLEGTLKLFESDYSDPVNIGSDEQVSINQMIEMIENISKNIENYNISKEKLIVANTA